MESNQLSVLERLSYYAVMGVKTQSEGSMNIFRCLKGWYVLEREAIDDLIKNHNLAPGMRKIFNKSTGWILVGPSEGNHMDVYWQKRNSTDREVLISGVNFSPNNPVIKAWNKRSVLMEEIEESLKGLHEDIEENLKKLKISENVGRGSDILEPPGDGVHVQRDDGVMDETS